METVLNGSTLDHKKERYIMEQQLAYEVLEDGYLITGGNLRIKQSNKPPFNFPYPGATIEESAQNHIAQISLDSQNSQDDQLTVQDQITQLRADLKITNSTVDFLLGM